MPTLHEVQRAFAACLLARPGDVSAWAAGDGIPAEARLRLYRNNSRAIFEQAMQLTYPVLLRRVGPDYFRQLAHHYRTAHPSRSGDLHGIGRAYADFLAAHLAGTPYAWLSELVKLEWAVAEAGVAADAPATAAESLAALAPEHIESARFRYVPSLRLVRSSVPVLSIWRANAPDGDGRPVDLCSGAECTRVHRRATDIVLRAVEPDEFDFIEATSNGATLGEALEASQLPLATLPFTLHRLFADEIIAEVMTPA